MNYVLKSGKLCRSGEVAAQITGTPFGPEKQIVVDRRVWTTDIRNAGGRRYLLLDASGSTVGFAVPECAPGEDPDPLCRMPKIDRARLNLHGAEYELVMESPQRYVLLSEDAAIVHITHRGLSGGWDIAAPAALSPADLCALFAFSRYIEKENEYLFV